MCVYYTELSIQTYFIVFSFSDQCNVNAEQQSSFDTGLDSTFEVHIISETDDTQSSFATGLDSTIEVHISETDDPQSSFATGSNYSYRLVPYHTDDDDQQSSIVTAYRLVPFHNDDQQSSFDAGADSSTEIHLTETDYTQSFSESSTNNVSQVNDTDDQQGSIDAGNLTGDLFICI